MANWGSGPPPTPEGVVLSMNFQKYVDVKQSILGSPLIFDQNGLSPEILEPPPPRDVFGSFP